MRKDLIIEWLACRNQILTDDQFAQLARFQEMVLTAPINLTAIKTDEGFAVKHFIDSFTLLDYVDKQSKDATYIDVGTGAGFPGIPLKIARPELDITLLDSLNKRVLFLRNVVDELGLQNMECVHARAEDIRTRYNVAFARAVANLPKLCDYVLPLVKPGGVFFAMKGPEVHEEIKNAKPVLDKFGAVIENVETVKIASGMKHTIIVIRKS